MAALTQGQLNTTTKLNWYITIAGVLTSVYEIGFRVIDISAGLPGTQIFPLVDGEYADVTANDGNFNAGSYYAFDVDTGFGWLVPLDATVGTHLIKWRWKVSSISSYQYGQEEFEVLAEGAGSAEATYVSLLDVRDLGISVEQASNDQVLAMIALAQELLERATRQWFVPRAAQFRFDGSNSDAVHFAVPIITIEWLKINDDTEELDPTRYRVYANRTAMPDDRHNPRIKLVHGSARHDLYSMARGVGALFLKGRQNQEVKGTFGYVEVDGTTPRAIREAMLRMVVERLSSPPYQNPAALPVTPPAVLPGVVIEEETDGHRIKYANLSAAATKPARAGLTGISQDPFVLDVIKLYRGPIGIAVPSSWTF